MATSNSTVPSDYLVNPVNPYFMHPSENPSFVLVSPPLIEKNYHNWAHSMIVALESKNKHRFVDGTLPIPASTDSMHDTWKRCNNMVISWLTRSMSPSIAQFVLRMRFASQIWSDLKVRFSRGDKFRIADLMEEIQLCKQGSTQGTRGSRNHSFSSRVE